MPPLSGLSAVAQDRHLPAPSRCRIPHIPSVNVHEMHLFSLSVSLSGVTASCINTHAQRAIYASFWEDKTHSACRIGVSLPLGTSCVPSAVCVRSARWCSVLLLWHCFLCPAIFRGVLFSSALNSGTACTVLGPTGSFSKV